jgi:hypothetical protein
MPCRSTPAPPPRMSLTRGPDLRVTGVLAKLEALLKPLSARGTARLGSDEHWGVADELNR